MVCVRGGLFSRGGVSVLVRSCSVSVRDFFFLKGSVGSAFLLLGFILFGLVRKFFGFLRGGPLRGVFSGANLLNFWVARDSARTFCQFRDP